MAEHEITSEAELRALMGEPVHELVLAKSSDSITEPMRKYSISHWHQSGDLWSTLSLGVTYPMTWLPYPGPDPISLCPCRSACS